MSEDRPATDNVSGWATHRTPTFPGIRQPVGGAIVLLCLIAMAWAAADSDGDARKAFLLQGQKSDYYNLLVDGFMEGHLNMKVQPDASGQLPYLMDASLHEGKYYLYFGVVPAVLLFLPYSWLTGHDLPENASVLIMVAAGFLFSLYLYRQARQRYFPSISAGLEAACVLFLGFAGGTAILCFDSGVYEVAIAGGYLCFSATLLGLFQAAHGGPRSLAWLAWASLWAGLAVGCRPTYLIAVPVLLIPVMLAVRRRSAATADPNVVRLAVAAIVPAALIGLGLAVYNYGRFGNPLEFGFQYQVSELIRSGLPLARLDFMWANLTWYYLTPPTFGPFFPFALPIDASVRPAQYYGYELIHGQWLMLPVCLLTGLVLCLLSCRKVRLPAPLLAFGLMTLLAFVTTFAVMLTFGFRANRYVVDFQPILVVALVLVGGAGCTKLAKFMPAAAQWLSRGFIILSLALCVFNYLVGIQWMDHLANTRPRSFATVSRYTELPSHALAQLGLLKYGPLQFRVKFNPVIAGREEMLLQIGTSGYEDGLYAVMHPGNRVEFILTNGAQSLRTPLSDMDFDREHELELSIGSLYPPITHRYFAGWSPLEVQKLKSSASLLLNREEIIYGSYAARSHTPYPSESSVPSTPYKRISAIKRLNRSHLATMREFGLWRFEVTFSPVGPTAQPVLGSGIAGAGNLLFVRHEGPGYIRLALDSWGYGLTVSEPIPLNTSQAHELEIFVGSQAGKQTWPESWSIPATLIRAQADRLVVWLNRKMVWDTPMPGNRDSYDIVTVGGNPQGFSTASAMFAGTLRRQQLSPEAKREILLRLMK